MRYMIKVKNDGEKGMVRLGKNFRKGTTAEPFEVSREERIALESTPNLNVIVVEEIPETDEEREMLNRETPQPVDVKVEEEAEPKPNYGSWLSEPADSEKGEGG